MNSLEIRRFQKNIALRALHDFFSRYQLYLLSVCFKRLGQLSVLAVEVIVQRLAGYKASMSLPVDLDRKCHGIELWVVCGNQWERDSHVCSFVVEWKS